MVGAPGPRRGPLRGLHRDGLSSHLHRAFQRQLSMFASVASPMGHLAPSGLRCLSAEIPTCLSSPPNTPDLAESPPLLCSRCGGWLAAP